jgi:uncharacterized SAM-dependent methyltransferase
MPYVTENGSRRSPLIWVLFNQQMNDPNNTDFRLPAYDHRALWVKNEYGIIDPFLPANRDLLTIIEWLDMGNQFSDTVSPQ